MKITLALISALLSWMTVALPDSALAEEESGLVAVGRELVSRHCSACHAIGADDVSRDPQALAFRTLGKRYPIESLEEALAEGIFTGHADMPELQFQPRDIKAVITYLQSIQQK
jgi:mono/diheme cytochrome c family protein